MSASVSGGDGSRSWLAGRSSRNRRRVLLANAPPTSNSVDSRRLFWMPSDGSAGPRKKLPLRSRGRNLQVARQRRPARSLFPPSQPIGIALVQGHNRDFTEAPLARRILFLYACC